MLYDTTGGWVTMLYHMQRGQEPLLLPEKVTQLQDGILVAAAV
jgi:hypothetical protein